MQDLHSNVKVSRLISPAAAITGNGTTTSQTIDTLDYGSLELILTSGALTDGVLTGTVYHGDASNMSDEAACAAADLIGSAPTFDQGVGADANAAKRVGYRGSKRYVRIKFVQTGATSGGFLSGVAEQGHPRVAPVS